MNTLKTPLAREQIEKLRIGDVVYLSGIIYTARDQAHRRALEKDVFPGDIQNGVVFHAGPVAQKKDSGWDIIAIGPTTSSRLDSLTPEFIERFNVSAIIGKGGMDSEVGEALKKNKAVYLAMTGGCAASTASMVREVRDVHWLDLGIPEAVWTLEVKELGPLIVAMDSVGGDIYEKVRQRVAERL